MPEIKLNDKIEVKRSETRNVNGKVIFVGRKEVGIQVEENGICRVFMYLLRGLNYRIVEA